MGKHQWRHRVGVEIEPWWSWHGHYDCDLCSRLGPASPLPNPEILKDFDTDDCPGTNAEGAISCDYCGLRTFWTEPFCPKCDYPRRGAQDGPKEFYERHLVAEARKRARGNIPTK